MTSEIKVDTISEQTSANGVTIDGLTIKDGNIQGSPALVGTTPSFTIGDGGAEDTKIVFDGNALDYYIGLDDSADNLIIGSGSTVGSNSLITIDSDGDFTLDATSDIILDSDAANWRFKDGGTSILEIGKPSGAVSFYSAVSDADILFKGNDGGAAITALTIDMSDAGTATFNHDISLSTDGAIIKFGANSEIVLTHVHDRGLSLSHDGGGDPDLILNNTASASDGNQLGQIFWNGLNSNGDEHTYAFILGQVRDVTDGEEDGQLLIYANKGGTSKQFLTIGANSTAASPNHEVCINEESQNIDFRVESNGKTHMLFVDGGNDRIGVNTNAPADTMHIKSTGNPSGDIRFILETNATDGNCAIDFRNSASTFKGGILYDTDDNIFKISTNGSNERLRITNSGELLVGKSSAGIANAGVELFTDKLSATVSAAPILYINRLSNDGNLVQFHQDGAHEGTISVNGSTVTYGAFTGSHWSRLTDNSKPTIFRGTIMDSIDEMMEWYQAVADVAESTDDEGNVTPAHTVKESISLGDKSVGDAITFTSNGTEYSGTIVKEDDVKHIKCKISDTADSKKIYGVFLS